MEHGCVCSNAMLPQSTRPLFRWYTLTQQTCSRAVRHTQRAKPLRVAALEWSSHPQCILISSRLPGSLQTKVNLGVNTCRRNWILLWGDMSKHHESVQLPNVTLPLFPFSIFGSVAGFAQLDSKKIPRFCPPFIFTSSKIGVRVRLNKFNT